MQNCRAPDCPCPWRSVLRSTQSCRWRGSGRSGAFWIEDCRLEVEQALYTYTPTRRRAGFPTYLPVAQCVRLDTAKLTRRHPGCPRDCSGDSPLRRSPRCFVCRLSEDMGGNGLRRSGRCVVHRLACSLGCRRRSPSSFVHLLVPDAVPESPWSVVGRIAPPVAGR